MSFNMKLASLFYPFIILNARRSSITLEFYDNFTIIFITSCLYILYLCINYIHHTRKTKIYIYIKIYNWNKKIKLYLWFENEKYENKCILCFRMCCFYQVKPSRVPDFPTCPYTRLPTLSSFKSVSYTHLTLPTKA